MNTSASKSLVFRMLQNMHGDYIPEVVIPDAVYRGIAEYACRLGDNYSEFSVQLFGETATLHANYGYDRSIVLNSWEWGDRLNYPSEGFDDDDDLGY